MAWYCAENNWLTYGNYLFYVILFCTTVPWYCFQMWKLISNSNLSSINNLFPVNTWQVTSFLFSLLDSTFSTFNNHVFTYIPASKNGMRGFCNYWVRARLHEIYLLTHAARLDNLEVKEVGLCSPQRAAERLRTPTAEKKTIHLF